MQWHIYSKVILHILVKIWLSYSEYVDLKVKRKTKQLQTLKTWATENSIALFPYYVMELV